MVFYCDSEFSREDQVALDSVAGSGKGNQIFLSFDREYFYVSPSIKETLDWTFCSSRMLPGQGYD